MGFREFGIRQTGGPNLVELYDLLVIESSSVVGYVGDRPAGNRKRLRRLGLAGLGDTFPRVR